MDIQSLHSDISSALHDDPAISEHLSNLIHHWSKDPKGFLWLDNCIYVPDMGNLQLKVLQHNHDHPVTGHFGQNRTINLIRRSYIWPEVWNSVKSYIKSCTTCMCSKPQRHHPYRLLKQPWNSISMDFIEKLLSSSGFDTILVIVDQLTKQSIFIPMVDTINAQLLAKLFVLHVFSKHGVPSYVTSNWGTEFVSWFFGLSERLWTLSSTSLPVTIQRVTDKPNAPIRLSNSTYWSIVTTSGTIGPMCGNPN